MNRAAGGAHWASLVLKCSVGKSSERQDFELVHHRTAATCWQWERCWDPEKCWRGRNRPPLFYSAEWSINKASLPLPSACMRGGKKSFSCFCRRDQEMFAFKSRFEDKKEERRILSYWESRAGRGGGKEEWMVGLGWEKRWRKDRERMYDWIWPSGTASCLLAGWMGGLCYKRKEWASRERCNRAFREDSGVQNKSSVTMEHRSAPSQAKAVSKFNYTHSVAAWRTQQLVSK